MFFDSSIYDITDITSSSLGAVTIAWIILVMVSNWLLFEKAGEKGWKSLIPIWNTIVHTKIAVQPENYWMYWLASIPITIIPLVGWLIGIVVSCIVNYKLASRFSNSSLVRVLAAIPFTRRFVLLYLGISKLEYKEI